MGTPEMPDLGKHCSVADCQQLDFLPFTCNACNQVFCLEHRQYTNHDCPNANDQDVTVIVCPLCNNSVRRVPTEDENITWERHRNTNCDGKPTKQPRCPVPRCNEMLIVSNKVLCNVCKREVCIKHRHGADHDCESFTKVNTINQSFFDRGNNFLKSFKEKTASLARQSSSKANRPSNGPSSSQSGSFTGALTTAASNLKSSMEAGINRLGSMATGSGNTLARQAQRVPSQRSSGQVLQTEVCPQCHSRFTTVGQLIQHVESMHDNPCAQDMLDVCPKCGKKFRDPISLVNHVEKDHGGSSS